MEDRCRQDDNIKMDLQGIGLGGGGMGMQWINLLQGQVMGCCECGNEPLGSIKCRYLLHYLRNYSLYKRDSAAWS